MKLAMTGNTDRSSTSVTESERLIRQDLAACYRLVAMFGWDDLLATHISAKLRDEDAFLINPLGLMFHEITASSLVKVNLEGEILGGEDLAINRAGFVIHSAIHAARPDAHCVIHLHTRDGVAVSCLEEGLLPLNQTAMLVHGSIAYHDYEGVAVQDEERARLVRDLGDRNLMLLRNHGTLSVGSSIPEAFLQSYWLEWSCSVQVRALSMNRPLHPAAPEVIKSTSEKFGVGKAGGAASYAETLLWPALLRKVEAQDSSFKS